MRLHFPNLERPKKAAKRITKALAGGLSLAKVQNALAVALGYRDWHELEIAHSANAPAPLDQELPVDLFRDRIAELTLKLAVALGVTDSEAQYVLLVSRLTGDRQVSLDDHINIRLMCWRANGLWPASGHAGTVVRLRFPNAGPMRLGLLTADFGSSGESPVQIVGDNFFGDLHAGGDSNSACAAARFHSATPAVCLRRLDRTGWCKGPLLARLCSHVALARRAAAADGFAVRMDQV